MSKRKYERWLTEEGLALIEGWAHDGLTDENIAHNMGIAAGTLYRWENEHNEIREALTKGKEVADYIIENALYKRAKGDSYTEVKTVLVDLPKDVVELNQRRFENQYRLDHPEASTQEIKDAVTEGVPTQKRVEVQRVDKEMPGDTTAQIFWLKNRRPDKWRDRREVQNELSGGLTVKNPYAGLSTEELRKLAGESDG